MITCPNFESNLHYNTAVTETIMLGLLTPNISFIATGMTVAVDAGPTSGLTLSCESGSAVTYTSDSTGVTVDISTGVITPVAVGTAVITAHCSKTPKYSSGTASYIVTVTQA